MKKLIRLVKSSSGRGAKQFSNLKALGLRKIGSSTVVEYTKDVAGRVEKVRHLIVLEDVA